MFNRNCTSIPSHRLGKREGRVIEKEREREMWQTKREEDIEGKE